MGPVPDLPIVGSDAFARRFLWGRLVNLRADCQSAQPGKARPFLPGVPGPYEVLCRGEACLALGSSDKMP